MKNKRGNLDDEEDDEGSENEVKNGSSKPEPKLGKRKRKGRLALEFENHPEEEPDAYEEVMNN